jgi:ABC-type glycerol-3-phosphate transport system permease component
MTAAPAPAPAAGTAPGRQLRRRARRPRLPLVMTHAALLVCGVAWLYPFLWALGGSLKSNDEFFSGGLNPLPHHVVWSNYVNAWRGASFGSYFLNTVVVAAGTTVLTVVVTAMAGYVLARTRFPGRGLCIGVVAATLFLPHGYTIIPIFDMIRRLGLLDSLWSVILVQSSGGVVFGTFLFMGYFQSMGPDLEDAARIDGASFHQTFWRVMLPMAGPMAATVGLFTAISAWNSFFIPLVFTLGRPELRTLSVGMYAFVGQSSTDWTLLCAGSVITLAPIVVLFLLLQRFFVNGLAGAVKQ